MQFDDESIKEFFSDLNSQNKISQEIEYLLDRYNFTDEDFEIIDKIIDYAYRAGWKECNCKWVEMNQAVEMVSDFMKHKEG